MNDNLSCGLVRDLLPSYLEGLTSEETNRALEEHLKTCANCAAALEAMGGGAEREAEEVSREVNYLKRVKRRSARKIVLAVVCTVLALVCGFALKIFVIGTPLQAQTLAVVEILEEQDQLRLRLSSMASANAYHGWRVEVEDGVACVYAREVLVSSLFRSGGGEVRVPLEGLREIWLGGRSGKLVWQDGTAIFQRTSNLLAMKTPYCGDPSALGNIAYQLRIPEELGSYTVSMDTAQRPYRWTLVFSSSLNDNRQKRMARCACVMMALVDNLDEVAWTWRDPSGEDPEGRGILVRESAGRMAAELTAAYNDRRGTSWESGDSIEDCTRTPADFQRLLESLELY